MLESVVSWIVATVGDLGYPGIVVMMFLESSFFPFPSEVVMIPAGYLAAKGEMHLTLVMLSGLAGSILGAIFNYYLALLLGRQFLLRYGRFMLIHERTIFKMEEFFATHGHISTFSGRLLPGIRQYISLPAGIARMHLGRFVLFTALGAGIWMTLLTLLGYFLGQNQLLVKSYLGWLTAAAVVFVAAITALYIYRHRRKGANGSV